MVFVATCARHDWPGARNVFQPGPRLPCDHSNSSRRNMVLRVLRKAGRTRELQSVARTASHSGLPNTSVDVRS